MMLFWSGLVWSGRVHGGGQLDLALGCCHAWLILAGHDRIYPAWSYLLLLLPRLCGLFGGWTKLYFLLSDCLSISLPGKAFQLCKKISCGCFLIPAGATAHLESTRTNEGEGKGTYADWKPVREGGLGRPVVGEVMISGYDLMTPCRCRRLVPTLPYAASCTVAGWRDPCEGSW